MGHYWYSFSLFVLLVLFVCRLIAGIYTLYFFDLRRSIGKALGEVLGKLDWLGLRLTVFHVLPEYIF